MADTTITPWQAEQNYLNSIAVSGVSTDQLQSYALALAAAQEALAQDEATIAQYAYLNAFYGLNTQNGGQYSSSLAAYYGPNWQANAVDNEKAYNAAVLDEISRGNTIITEEGPAAVIAAASNQLAVDEATLADPIVSMVMNAMNSGGPGGYGMTIAQIVAATGLTQGQVLNALASGFQAQTDATTQKLLISKSKSALATAKAQGVINTGNIGTLFAEYFEMIQDQNVINFYQNAINNAQAALKAYFSNAGGLFELQVLTDYNNLSTNFLHETAAQIVAQINSELPSQGFYPFLTTALLTQYLPDEAQILKEESIVTSYQNAINAIQDNKNTISSQIGSLSGVYANMAAVGALRTSANNALNRISSAQEQLAEDQAIIAKYAEMVKLYNSYKRGDKDYQSICRQLGLSWRSPEEAKRIVEDGVKAYYQAVGAADIQTGIITTAQNDIVAIAKSNPDAAIGEETTLANNDLDALMNAQNQLTQDQATITEYELLYRLVHSGMSYREAAAAYNSQVSPGLTVSVGEALRLYSQALGDKAVQLGIIATYQNYLSAIPGLGSNFTSLFNAQNNMNANGLNNSTFTNGNSRTQFMSLMTTLLQAMQYHLQANFYSTMLALNPNMTVAQAQAAWGQYMDALNSENNLLMNLITSGQKNLVSWDQIYNTANIDKHSYAPVQEWFQGAGQKQQQDQWLMNLARNMMNLIIKLISNLAEEIAKSSMVGLSQMMMTLQYQEQQIVQIMNNPNLSVSEKAAQILPILFSMLNLFDAFKGEIESVKTKNEKLMSQAVISSSEMKIQDAQANAKIQLEETKNQKIMKIFSTALIVAMTILMAVMAPYLIPLLVAFAAYDITTTWDSKAVSMTKLLDPVTQGHGDIAWSSIEAVATMGAEVAIEKVAAYRLERIAATTIREGDAAAEAAVKDATETSAKASHATRNEHNVRTGLKDERSLDQMRQEAEIILREILKRKQKFIEKSLSKLYSEKGLGAFFNQSQFKTTVKEANQKAIDSLAKDVPEKVGFKVVFKEGDKAGFKEGDTADLAAADASAAEIVSEMISVNTVLAATGPLEALWKFITGGKTKDEAYAANLQKAQDAGDTSWASSLKSAGKAGNDTVTNFEMAMMINNVLVNNEGAIDRFLKKLFKLSDEQFQEMQQVMQILMQIIQGIVLAYVGYKKMQGSTNLNGLATNATLQQAASFANVGAMSAQGAVQLVRAQSLQQQAETVIMARYCQMILNMLFQSLRQLQKNTQNDRDTMFQQISADVQSNKTTQQNSMTGIVEGIRVLQASAV
jgi:hypothetical protein